VAEATYRAAVARWPAARITLRHQHALRSKQDILFSNERNINILGTHHFGRLGFVEIGALSVGRIVQTHPLDKSFDRGQEKSVFRFGGSAIAVFASKEMAECDRLDKRSEP
jgi:phosphatidylserine decarboxylase